MKKSIRFLLGMVCVVSVMLCGLCACTGSKPSGTVSLDPIDDGGLAGRPTVAVPYGQMTFNDLMGMNGATIEWSRLSKYTHTMLSGTTAVFYVADGYGEEMELHAEFDTQNDTVTKADVCYGDMVVSILTDDDAVLMPVLQALREHHAQATATAPAA